MRLLVLVLQGAQRKDAVLRSRPQSHLGMVGPPIGKGPGADVNVKLDDGVTPLDAATNLGTTEIADLLRKNGGKTGEELKAEGK